MEKSPFFCSLVKTSLKDIFLKGYQRENNVLEGILSLINALEDNYHSNGWSFLISKPFDVKKISQVSPLKRWNMFLRWMVRDDKIDFGLWKDKVEKKDLIIPLDTHTFNISKKLGLLQRKTYDLKSAILLTQKLKEFDRLDPVKYDFALYRIGQEKLIL